MIRLIILVTIHLFIVVGNIISFFIFVFIGFGSVLGFNVELPIWPVCLVCSTIVFNLCFLRQNCECTKWENDIRRELNMPEIKGFIKHYILKNVVRIRRKLR